MRHETDLTARLAGGRLLVIGDVMLDRYVNGRVSRISPEAPVPVLHAESERNGLGGAGNLAANLAALGAQAILIGVCGRDVAQTALTQALGALKGVETELFSDPGRPTIVKTRFLCDRQQILRVDHETAAPIGRELEDAILAATAGAVSACDGMILSDYAKGVLSDRVIAGAIAIAKSAGIPVFVDPKRPRLGDYHGADYITPNRKELFEATGIACNSDEDAARAAAAAIETSGAAILLTRSEQGMSLFRRGFDALHLRAEAREVFDVSGAGDTVAATFALAVVAGLAPETAMRMANAAAGIVVQRLGAAACSAADLDAALTAQARRELDDDDFAAADSPAAIAEKIRHWRAQGLKIGFANGCFDLIHSGHVALIRRAAAQCDRLIVALNSDASVQRLKGPSRPVQNETARAQVMAAIKGVDAVAIFDADTPYDLIGLLEPDILFKGADYREDQVVGADIVKARGGRVILIELVDGQSTTKLVRRTREAEASAGA